MINKIPLQDEVIESLSNRILNHFPQNPTAIDTFIKLTETANIKEKAKDLIVNLISSEYYQTGLDSFKKHYEFFRQRDREEIGKAIISRYQSLPLENWEVFLNILEVPEITFSKAFTDNFGENLLEHLKSEDINIRNIGKRYYLTIKNHISDRKAKFIGQQLITKLNSIQPNINENANPIFEILMEEQERLEKYTLEDLIDILLSLLHESKPIEVRNMAIRCLVSLKRLYRRSYQVLDQLLDLSKRANPGERESIVEALISFKDYKGRRDFWKDAKEHFKKLKKSENESDRVTGSQALKKLK